MIEDTSPPTPGKLVRSTFEMPRPKTQWVLYALVAVTSLALILGGLWFYSTLQAENEMLKAQIVRQQTQLDEREDYITNLLAVRLEPCTE